jgi:VWFA-related protein
MMLPHSRRRFLEVLAAAPAIARAQATFSSAVEVVSLLVTVRDKDGRFVKELTKDDFAVTDDGAPQPISYFTRQYDLPLTIGLLIDTSGSQVDVLSKEIDASVTFFKQVIREGTDEAFLSSFDTRSWLLKNLTTSPAELEKALGILNSGVRTRHYANGTVLYDDIADSADLILARQHGRKALILLTDGEDTTSRATFDRALEACQRADTVVYSIGIGTALPNGRGILKSLAEKTGGRFFDGNHQKSTEEIYKTIEAELRSQYNLGYAPPANDPGKGREKYHKVKVTVGRPGLIVGTREGYYAAADHY